MLSKRKRGGPRKAAPQQTQVDVGYPYIAPAPRLQVLAEHLHRLGPRAVYEVIAELAARFGPEVLDRVEVYAKLDPRIVRALGGHRFPCRLAMMRGGRR